MIGTAVAPDRDVQSVLSVIPRTVSLQQVDECRDGRRDPGVSWQFQGPICQSIIQLAGKLYSKHWAAFFPHTSKP